MTEVCTFILKSNDFGIHKLSYMEDSENTTVIALICIISTSIMLDL
jgi:hypothetical protein